MTPVELDNELQRRLELLAGKALGDLSADEQATVDELLRDAQWQTALWQLEATAAAVDLRLRPKRYDALPASLATQLQRRAEAFFEPSAAASQAARTLASDDAQLKQERAPHALDPRADQARGEPVSRRSPPRSVIRREWLGWVCCAAAVLLSVGMWLIKDSQDPSPLSSRNKLLASADDVMQIEWGAGTTPFDQAVSGDVVWSTAQQTGFMRFRGMPVNDPATEQYQLWIIDPQRDEQPIDGGVFDIPASGEVVVPIHAKLAVIDPQAFAITVEKPGGVVVSDQQRLPLLASVP